MSMKKIAVGIILLFIVTSVSPLVVGYSSNNSGSEYEEVLDNLAFMCYDENSGNEKYEYYKKYVLNDCSNNDLDVVEVVKPVESSTVSPSKGPMDSPWPIRCHDLHHTSRSPFGTDDNPLTEKWKFRTENQIRSGIIIGDDGTIYFGSFDRYLYALNPNGTLKWKYGKTGMWIWSTPALSEDEIVYVTSYDAKIHAVYSNNGTLKWKKSGGGSISSSPVIATDGTIYFGAMGPGNFGRIWALHPNGTEKWHYDTGYWITSDPAVGDDGTVYIGSGDNYLYALYPNGTLRWRFKTGHYVKGPPSIADDGTIYVGSWDDYLYALHPNGTMKWRHGVGAGTESNPSIGHDGTIYVGGGYLYAIYPNGTRKWTFDFGSNKHSHQSSPAISADGTIFIGTIIGNYVGGEILAVNPDGTERWRVRIAENEVQSSPCIGSDGTVYVGSASTSHTGSDYGYLHAFGRKELEADANGPYLGIKNEPVQFTGSADGGYPPYDYLWSFGDGETSEEQNPIHEYDMAGNYTITLTVTDDNETTVSDTTYAVIRESNDPPSIPVIDGETQGYYGESYEYTFITSDIDGDDIFYYIEWGDGKTEEWLGPYSSGKEVIRSHTWDDEDTYTIRAKAKDYFGLESDWAYLEVTMPVSQPVQFPIISWLLQHFPNLFPILRHLNS